MTAIGAALASALLLASGDAAAAITLGTPTLGFPSGYTQPSPRPSGDRYWISYDDCKNDIVLQLTVDTTDPTFSWAASADGTCPLGQGITTNTVLAQCWQPAGATDLLSGSTVTIRAQDLVQGTLGITNCDPTTAPMGVSWPQPITVFFYYPSTSPTESTTWTQTSLALAGPNPPPVSLGTGPDETTTELTVTLPEPAPLASTVGYDIFCYPVGGAEGPADGGTSTCPAGTAIPGLDLSRPDPTSPYLCGQVMATTPASYDIQSIQGNGPTPGQVYAVGVAAYDALGNVGPLSPLLCASPSPPEPAAPTYIPRPVDNRSSCAIRDAGTSGAGAAVLGIAGLLGLAMASRARRRR